MREKVLKYTKHHDGFCPSFSVIYTGSKAVVSIKHRGTDRNVGHQEVGYGLLFNLRLAFALSRCFKKQIKHKLSTSQE